MISRIRLRFVFAFYETFLQDKYLVKVTIKALHVNAQNMAQVIWNSDIDVYNSQVIPVLVARNISKYLSVQDLLSFGQVSRNTFRTVNDPNLWVSKLKDMGVWEHGIMPSSQKIELYGLDNPLVCLDKVVKSPKVAKLQVRKIYRCLYPYYNDLLSHKPYNKLKIFKDFQTPEDQAKILDNILKLNKIDYDEQSGLIIKDKINSLFEIFENALLRELEIHYDIQDYAKTRKFVKILIRLKNQQTLIDFFLQKSIFDNEECRFFNIEEFQANEYFVEKENLIDTNSSEEDTSYDLNISLFDKFIEDLAKIFNNEARIIDQIFPQEIPMMYKVCEELIANQVMELFMALLDASKPKLMYLTLVPYLYQILTTTFIEKLTECENVGPSYPRLVRELIDMLYESFAAEYIREELQIFKGNSNQSIKDWKDSFSRREAETTQSILKHVKVETKNDFLTSFKKVFTINASSNKDESESDEKNYSEIQAKTKILSENLKSLNKIFSLELVMDILNEARGSFNRLLNFRDFSIVALKNDILASTQEVFITVIDSTGNEHLRPGFEKALEYLKTYNPKELELDSNSESFIEPLVLYCELINMADMIIQMIDIFYKEEMLNRHIVKHENSILNPALQNKKKLEGLVDNYVADGLNIGIDVLMTEIENAYKTYLKDSDYNPPSNTSTVMDGPTEAATKVVKILDNNIDLLVGSTDKSIVEVFQQEIAERFFQLLVKTLKRSTISVSGAINLISDLNLYYDFIVNHIKTNKRMIIPLYQSLKKVGSIYLIGGNESKSIGKLVSDLSKFNGIFGQEEIYEFVQRRQDWPLIKRDVEKVMYGLSLGDCVII